jgi:DNA-binding CsgD family transcriptional regulator
MPIKSLLHVLGLFSSINNRTGASFPLVTARIELQMPPSLPTRDTHPSPEFADPDASQELFWTQWQNLTRREQEVTALLCLDFSNQEIASELHISIATAKTHVHHILHKLTARNRTHLQQLLSGWDLENWYKNLHSHKHAKKQ